MALDCVVLVTQQSDRARKGPVVGDATTAITRADVSEICNSILHIFPQT